MFRALPLQHLWKHIYSKNRAMRGQCFCSSLWPFWTLCFIANITAWSATNEFIHPYLILTDNYIYYIYPVYELNRDATRIIMKIVCHWWITVDYDFKLRYTRCVYYTESWTRFHIIFHIKALQYTYRSSIDTRLGCVFQGNKCHSKNWFGWTVKRGSVWFYGRRIRSDLHLSSPWLTTVTQLKHTILAGSKDLQWANARESQRGRDTSQQRNTRDRGHHGKTDTAEYSKSRATSWC